MLLAHQYAPQYERPEFAQEHAMCPFHLSENTRLSPTDVHPQPPGEFSPCNCGHPGPLGRERCGADMAAFAVRCPGCNKSVQAFTEQALPVNWNAVSRKHAPVQPAAYK